MFDAYQEEMEAEFNARYGDPRRCPKHGTAISSPDGMFDAPCGKCEGEDYDAWLETLPPPEPEPEPEPLDPNEMPF